jgi:hypothetical protein
MLGYHMGRVASFDIKEDTLTVCYPFDGQKCEHDRTLDDWEAASEVVARAQKDELAMRLLGQMREGEVHKVKELLDRLKNVGHHYRWISSPVSSPPPPHPILSSLTFFLASPQHQACPSHLPTGGSLLSLPIPPS